MRYLILSDIHGNWEALQAVLQASEGTYDQIVCCGDLVGYGPDPNRVVEWARESVASTVRGNHDRACCGMASVHEFTPLAQAGSIWTMSHLTEPNAEWLRGLPKGPLTVDGFQLAHGSPSDEDEYVFSVAEAYPQRPFLTSRLTFFGHTHLQGGFLWSGDRIRALGAPLPGYGSTVLALCDDSKYLINPGSVGQPRDSDPRAAWAVYESDARIVRLCRVSYDYTVVLEKILAAGLPSALGYRLAVGR